MMAADLSDSGSFDPEAGSDCDEYRLPQSHLSVSVGFQAPLDLDTVNGVIRNRVNRQWSARNGQFEVFEALWRGQDVVCTFPTSSGKTLIMMLGPLLDHHFASAGVWIVCQPLEALRNTTSINITRTYFAGTRVNVIVWTAADHDLDDLSSSVTVILCSPEQLLDVYAKLIHFVPVVRALFVDEAHLRFAWEFRDYKPCDLFSTKFPDAVIGLFSATLNRTQANELVRLMAMRRVVFFTENEFPALREMKLTRWDQFDIRCISMEPDTLVAAILATFVKLPPQDAIIVFAGSYAKFARLAEPLGRIALASFSPRMYCAAFPDDLKEETCAMLNSGDCRLVGATCALGAGVNLLNVGAIIFFGCPKSFIDATQAMGRAGRGAHSPSVEIIFASDAQSNSKVDNEMRLLMEYCSALKSSKTVQCSLCHTVRPCPTVQGAADVYRTCFDFIGVHCERSGRCACKRTMCKVFDGLLPGAELANAVHDCNMCDACKRARPIVLASVGFPVGSQVRYKGENAVVTGYTSSQRCQIREIESWTNHTVATASLSIVSMEAHQFPPEITLNNLDKKEREVLTDILRKKFVIVAQQSVCLLSCVPNEKMIGRLVKWSARDCSLRFTNISSLLTEDWFFSAQTEAAHVMREREEATQKEYEGIASPLSPPELGLLPMDQDPAANDVSAMDPALMAYMAAFYDPVMAQLASSAAGAIEKTTHRRLQQQQQMPRGGSLGGTVSLPQNQLQSKKKKRRSTLDGFTQRK